MLSHNGYMSMTGSQGPRSCRSPRPRHHQLSGPWSLDPGSHPLCHDYGTSYVPIFAYFLLPIIYFPIAYCLFPCGPGA